MEPYRGMALSSIELKGDRPVIIALAGASATGKSTLLEAIEATFGEQVICVPEVARLIRKHLKKQPTSADDVWEMQVGIFKIHRIYSGVYESHAKSNHIPIIVYDRTAFDGLPYLIPCLTHVSYADAVEAFERLCQIPRSEWDTYYDHLFFLGMPSEQEYLERRPTGAPYPVARRRGEWLFELWKGHPGLVCVPYDGDFELTKAFVLNAIGEIVQRKMDAQAKDDEAEETVELAQERASP